MQTKKIIKKINIATYICQGIAMILLLIAIILINKGV